MNIRIKFLGGARTVTGSKYLLEIDDFRLLIDCGLFQGLKPLRLRNWDDFPLDPSTINAVILTHAHLDHTGYLPRLFKQGYSGPVYCTSATNDLVEILLKDSAKLQVEEAIYARKKGFSKHENPLPLYNSEDVDLVLPRMIGMGYNEDIRISENISIRFLNASHILGASMVELTVTGTHQEKKLLFSGDIGRFRNPLLFPPQLVKQSDILVIESTYGIKSNPFVKPEEELAEVINETINRKGCVLIPAFAVGRTQLILYYLKELLDRGIIPEIPIYMDSPMAITTTNLYEKHFEFHRLDKEEMKYEESFIKLRKNLHIIQSQVKSMALNEISERAIIISASGMLNGGRILHHLYRRLPRENDSLILVGYQAEGTRGRRIVDGDKEIRIFGQEVPIKCHVYQIDGFSAHADREELYFWLDHFEKPPKKTFVVHGEEKSAIGFAINIKEKYGWNTEAPGYLDSAELFKGI